VSIGVSWWYMVTVGVYSVRMYGDLLVVAMCNMVLHGVAVCNRIATFLFFLIY